MYASSCNEDDRVKGIFYDVAESKILNIAKRIKTSDNEKDKMNLIWALLYINYKCHCVKNNSEAIKFITDSKIQPNDNVSSSERHYKEMYDKALKTIRSE